MRGWASAHAVAVCSAAALFLGRSIPFLGRFIPFLGRHVPFLGSCILFLGSYIPFLGSYVLDWFNFTRHALPQQPARLGQPAAPTAAAEVQVC